ncbi:flagellar hook-associated protein 2 [Bacillus sp. NEB1478]|uniref:flagellar hook-associated protein 2 n=1 Tax=Bacillus sp. NEB1478 TaxID=3073816 RepID=UPI002872D5AC|nr:flagellar hook-associated protein 2 [Bacillus sp. NEB1478]WNB93912.1 flagellar hook-associated protein 2 [Bacillus sp. NEB1478]
MRIGGLASGMDIDSIVKDMMKAERIPLDKLSQKRTQLEWQRDDYRSINKLLDDLDKSIFDGIGKQGKFTTKTVTNSNSSVVSATANGTAVNTSVNIEVLATASSAIWVGGSKDLTSYQTVGNKTLTFTVTDGAGTNQGVKTIDINDGDTVDTIISKFNTSGLGVTAFYDKQNQKFVLTKKDTGFNSSIVVDDASTAAFMSELGYSNTTGEITGKTAGNDASFKINGYQTTRATNTFDISGVTYTLQQAGKANISIANNLDSTVDVIKNFVEKYNETVDSINKKISETKYRKFPPLTDEQRKDLSEKEAELWDEKAKSGMLRGDSILSNGLNIMRQNLYETVNTGYSDYNQLTEIGITTGNYFNKGKLEIDEDKLRHALTDNPDSVMKLFTGFTDSGGNEVRGIAKNLRETIHSTIQKIESKAGKSTFTNAQFTLGRELTDVNSRISAFEDRLTQVENRYWRQFTAMEKAIQQSNQQSMYLMQQFGGGQ